MTNSNPVRSGLHASAPLTPVMRIRVKQRASSGAPMRNPARGSLPHNPHITALTSLGPPKLSGGSVPGRMITLTRSAPTPQARKLNLNGAPVRENPSNPVVEALKWNSVEDWYYVNATPDTHPMHTHLYHLQGDRPLQLRRRRVRGKVRGPTASAARCLDSGAIPGSGADSSGPPARPVSGYGQGQPGTSDRSARHTRSRAPHLQQRTASHTPEIRAPLHIPTRDNDQMERSVVQP